MRRTNYGLNFQTINAAKWFQLMPISYTEVVPGDTISGTVQSRLFSDTTTVPLLNRSYFDMFAFYVPYRLLFEGWPKFISNRDETIPVLLPTVTDLFRQNYERNFVVSTGVAPTENVAWYRFCYNLIYNQFFIAKQEDNTSIFTFRRDQDQGGELGITPMRQSTFMESLTLFADHKDVPLVASTIRELRQEFATDRYNRARDYYGDKYTDYLAALGVEASWSILDEPEVIGMKHCDMKYRTTQATNNIGSEMESIGDPAGYYDGVCTLNLKKTFCPEHGLIAIYATPRMDTINSEQGSAFVLSKNSLTDYYTPERVTQVDQLIPDACLGTGHITGAERFATPMYDDFRKGTHQLTGFDAASEALYYFASTPDVTPIHIQYNTRNPNQIDDYFQGRLGGDATKINYQVTSVHRLKRSSPIRPAMATPGVS